MVVWLRKNQDGIAIPDGVIRRSAWLQVGQMDAAFQAIEEMRLETLARAEAEAQAIIDAAHDEAERIREAAEVSAQSMFDAARADGLQTGTEQWNEVVLKATRVADEQLRQQRARMARLVIAAVEKIVPVQDPQGIYRQVLRMLSKSMQTVRYVTVRVAPQELGYAETALRELATGSVFSKLIEVTADDRLAVGACLVESDQGIIDLSLNSQLKALRAAISLSVTDPESVPLATSMQENESGTIDA